MGPIINVSDIRSEAQALLDAIDLLEKRYPNHQLTLVPRIANASGYVRTTYFGGPRGELFDLRTNRDKVRDATRDWNTLAGIMQATQLTKKQIYGVLTSPDEKRLFERREAEGQAKEYRFVGAADVEGSENSDD